AEVRRPRGEQDADGRTDRRATGAAGQRGRVAAARYGVGDVAALPGGTRQRAGPLVDFRPAIATRSIAARSRSAARVLRPAALLHGGAGDAVRSAARGPAGGDDRRPARLPR